MAPVPLAQFKVRLEESLIERLRQQAGRFGRKSGNEIAAEIIENYVEFWERAEESKQAVLDRQRRQAGVNKKI